MKSVLLILLSFIKLIPAVAQDQELIVNDSSYIYRSIDEAMKSPDRVYRLFLTKRKLESFPVQVLQFKNLTELDLSRNRLEEIPPEIGQLVNLRRLNLANNNLVHLPNEIGNLTELVYLGLNRNIIEDLPPSIGKLQKLEVLELWDNELKDLPDEISELQNLKLLELRGILFTDEQQQRIDGLVVKSARIYMSPSCNCRN